MIDRLSRDYGLETPWINTVSERQANVPRLNTTGGGVAPSFTRDQSSHDQLPSSVNVKRRITESAERNIETRKQIQASVVTAVARRSITKLGSMGSIDEEEEEEHTHRTQPSTTSSSSVFILILLINVLLLLLMIIMMGFVSRPQRRPPEDPKTNVVIIHVEMDETLELCEHLEMGRNLHDHMSDNISRTITSEMQRLQLESERRSQRLQEDMEKLLVLVTDLQRQNNQRMDSGGSSR